MKYIDVKCEKDLDPILRFKTWDNVISLGGTCQVAFQLKRLELRRESMPFDWIFLTEPEDIIRAVETDFEGWLTLDNLAELGESQTDCRRIIDNKFNAIHQHIFPMDKTYEEAYPEVKKIVMRRLDRVLSLRGEDKDILFVRLNMPVDDAKRLGDIIREKYGPNAYLLVVNHTKEMHVRQLVCDISNVLIYEIFDENENTGQKWQGHNPHWDLLLCDAELKKYNGSCLNLKRDILFEGAYSMEQEKNGEMFRWTGEDCRINLGRFTGKTVELHLSSRVSNKIRIYNEHDKVIARGRFVTGYTGRFVWRLNKPEATIRIKVDEDSSVIRIKPDVLWSPRELDDVDDDRKLGVCIRSCKVSE